MSNQSRFESVEKGVMVMKNGKAWDVVYSDGKCTAYGWIDPAAAQLHDPRFCTNPTSVTYQGGSDLHELEYAEVVAVTRTVTVQVDAGD